MKYLQQLNWRYATKRMNGTKVAPEKLNNILEAIRLAPSSYGLQPFEVVVVEDDATKAKLSAAAYNQPQIIESSAVIVFAANENVTTDDVEAYINNIATTRNIPAEALADFKNTMNGTVNSLTPEQLHQWAAKQAYIAMGVGIVAASLEEVDATPMEGFNPEAVDDVLGLKEKGLKSVLLLPIGYRDEANDYLGKAIKVRRPVEDFITRYETELV